MTRTSSFLENPEDTREAIMEATYLALCEHGFADLTIQTIGDEFEKSKSLLYHHYDSKDELLLDFLEFMLERFEDQLPFHEEGGAEAHVDAIVERAFTTTVPGELEEFTRAMVELRAQAAHDEDYREHFTRSDQFFREHVADVIQSGIDRGVFRAVDPEQTAALFQTLFTGTMMQRATTMDAALEDGQAEFERYVRECLLA